MLSLRPPSAKVSTAEADAAWSTRDFPCFCRARRSLLSLKTGKRRTGSRKRSRQFSQRRCHGRTRYCSNIRICALRCAKQSALLNFFLTLFAVAFCWKRPATQTLFLCQYILAAAEPFIEKVAASSSAHSLLVRFGGNLFFFLEISERSELEQANQS